MKERRGNDGDPEEKESTIYDPGVTGLVSWSGRHLCLLILHPDKNDKQAAFLLRI